MGYGSRVGFEVRTVDIPPAPYGSPSNPLSCVLLSTQSVAATDRWDVGTESARSNAAERLRIDCDAHKDVDWASRKDRMSLLDVVEWTRRVLAESKSKPEVLVLFPLFAFAIGSVCSIVVIALKRTRLARFTPRYTVLVLVAGILIGVAEEDNNPSGVLSDSINSWSNISPKLIKYVFLPPLLFADTFFVDLFAFMGALFQILWQCIPSVLATTFLMATLAKYTLTSYGWGWQTSIAFGAIIAGTDPVGVVALFKGLKVEEKVAIIAIGESHVADGVTSVVFFLYLDFLSGKTYNAGQVVETLFKSALGGPAIGLAIAIAGGLLIISPFLKVYDTVVQITISVCVAWLAFFAAEINLHANGLLAVIAAGMMLGFMSWTSITGHAKEAMEHFWHSIEYFANIIVFLLAGIIVVQSALGNIGGQDWGYMVLMYCFLMAVRGVALFVSIPILNRVGPHLEWREWVVIWWGGLRGALNLAFALILSLQSQEVTEDGEEKYTGLPSVDGERILFLTGGIAAITLIVNGNTTGRLVSWLGLGEMDTGQKILLHETKRMLFKELNRSFDKLAGPVVGTSQAGHVYTFLPADFEVVARHIPSMMETEDGRKKRKLLKRAMSSADLKDPAAYAESSTMKIVRSRFLHSLNIQYDNMLEKHQIHRWVAHNLKASIHHGLEHVGTELGDWHHVEKCCASYGALRRKMRRIWQRLTQYMGISISSRHSKRLMYALAFIEAHLAVQKEMCEVVRAAKHLERVESSASMYSLFDQDSSMNLGSLHSVDTNDLESSIPPYVTGLEQTRSPTGSGVELSTMSESKAEHDEEREQKSVHFSKSTDKREAVKRSKSFVLRGKAKAARLKANLVMMNFDDEGCFLNCVEKVLAESEAMCQKAQEIVTEEVTGDPNIAISVKNQQVIRQLLHQEVSLVKGMVHHGLLEEHEAHKILHGIELKILHLPHVSRYSAVYLP